MIRRISKKIIQTDAVLEVSGVSKRFGGLQALSDIGMTIQRGHVYGLIGPNGAGKTTFLNWRVKLSTRAPYIWWPRRVLPALFRTSGFLLK